MRHVLLKGGSRLQWTLDFARRQTHENLTIEASIERAASLLGPAYRQAHLFTLTADIVARVSKSGAVRVTTTSPTRRAEEAASEHDRTKQSLIPEGTPVPFLVELDVMTPGGQVKNAKRRKFRQINRFLEFVDDIYPSLPPDGVLKVIDFGCGLSYLTFAVQHLLQGVHGRDVRLVGLDRNPTVIDRCRRTAAACDLQQIDFVCDTIGPVAQRDESPVHLAIALHACDGATDDALAAAVRRNAQVILAAPCCQHEVMTQLDSPPLELLTRHGILKERFAALATDALRAAILEQHGYRTQVIEFIESEHTPKNLLLRAVRRGASPTTPSPVTVSPASVRLDTFKQLLGLPTTRLEELLSK